MKVFLSHSTKDGEFVKQLAAALIGAGHEPWLCEVDIEKQENFVAKIEEGLRWCDVALVVWSPDAAASKWTEEEWTSVLARQVAEQKTRLGIVLLRDHLLYRRLRTHPHTRHVDRDCLLIDLERHLDETEVGPAKFATFTEITPDKGAAFVSQADLLPAHLGLDLKDAAVIDHDMFVSIYNPGKLALLTGWKDAQAASKWSPRKIEGIEKLRHRRIRIVRDYGRFDRREAPQFYADVEGRETLHARHAEAMK